MPDAGKDRWLVRIRTSYLLLELGEDWRWLLREVDEQVLPALVATFLEHAHQQLIDAPYSPADGQPGILAAARVVKYLLPSGQIELPSGEAGGKPVPGTIY